MIVSQPPGKDRHAERVARRRRGRLIQRSLLWGGGAGMVSAMVSAIMMADRQGDVIGTALIAFVAGMVVQIAILGGPE